jgi:hypothetical protein
MHWLFVCVQISLQRLEAVRDRHGTVYSIDTGPNLEHIWFVLIASIRLIVEGQQKRHGQSRFCPI